MFYMQGSKDEWNLGQVRREVFQYGGHIATLAKAFTKNNTAQPLQLKSSTVGQPFNQFIGIQI